MRRILALRGSIQEYDWGSRSALAELTGRPAPTPRPEAELWLGAHARSPAEVRVAGRWERLDAFLARTGEALLGPVAAAAFGARLPFLFKILAVARPLSLQAHPDEVRAREVFEGGPQDGPPIYGDPHGKPEIVCALSRFRALCGFVRLDELRARFAAVGLEHLVPPGDEAQTVFPSLLRDWLGADPATRATILRGAVARAADRTRDDRVSGRLCALAEAFPDDPGVLAPLFLHEVELEPGDALYLAPGVPHAYLDGVAAELMASSDNVLRGGLTAKPVHVAELLRVLRFDGAAPSVLRPEPRVPGEAVWRTEAAEFELSELRPSPEAPVVLSQRASIEILWCAEGELRVVGGEDDGVWLRRGESCLVPASVGPYRVAGAGRAFRAGLPLPRTGCAR